MSEPNPYHEKFPKGTLVRIVGLSELEQFRTAWKLHHPLQPNQFEHAGALARVREVAFYHGGEVLYQLDDVPGTWHESCLVDA